ncbi:hypothetical protein EVAR_5924_1 [Eumeta japonica]|uniref:Uncharacterized protein n=1 Tax=Eumeta variegata TaxID=151549 RepID=A0A4C1TC48_EUMVA|nr:hypothetical protein EVAR_5924_1 [Eumeta japonica]
MQLTTLTAENFYGFFDKMCEKIMVKRQASSTDYSESELTRNKFMLVYGGIGRAFSFILTAGQNHQFGSLLAIANETQARSRVKTAGIDQQEGCSFSS